MARLSIDYQISQVCISNKSGIKSVFYMHMTEQQESFAGTSNG